MSREIIATIVTIEGIREKHYPIVDMNRNLVMYIKECLIADGETGCFYRYIDSDEEQFLLLLPDYYDDPNHSTYGGRYPFILKDGKVAWNVPFEEVTIADFINTHGLKKNEPIRINIGGGIGGFGGDCYSIICDWLQAAQPYFANLKEGIEWIAAVMTIMQCFKGRDGVSIDPKDARNFFRNRKKWTPQEIKAATDLEPGDAMDCVLSYSEFEKQNGAYIRKRCSDVKHLEKSEIIAQNLWGKYSFGNCIDMIAAEIHDINRALTDIKVIAGEIGSDAFDIADEYVDSFIRKWPEIVKRGEKYQFLQLTEYDEDDRGELSEDLEEFKNKLETIRRYLNKRILIQEKPKHY